MLNNVFNIIGESGVDTLGLQREIFSLIVPKIRDSGLFIGCHGKMLPVQNSAGIASGEIKTVGKVLGAAVLHGRMRLEFLNPVFAQLLITGEPSDLAIELVPDASMRDLVKRIQAATTQASLDASVDDKAL